MQLKKSFKTSLRFKTSLSLSAILLFIVSCTTPGGGIANPSSFKATPGVVTVNLAWVAVADATGYVLERKEGNSNQFVLVPNFKSNDGKLNNFEDKNLKTNTTYTYRIKTVKGSAQSAGVLSNPVTTMERGAGVALNQLTPIWTSKEPISRTPQINPGEVAAIKAAGTNVNAPTNSTTITTTGSGEVVYYLGGLCTEVTATVSGSGSFILSADEKQLWTGTSGSATANLVGKQQLSLVYQGSGTGTWTNPTVFCQSTPTAPDAKAINGEWLPEFSWGGATPIVPTHAANLPDGRIATWASWKEFTYGYKGDGTDCPEGASLGYCEETEGFIWNYKTNVFEESDNPTHDMFCAGLAILPDGRVFGGGGGSFNFNDSAPASSQYRTSFFDFRNNTWTEGTDGNMDFAHWYGTAVAMPDSRVFMVGGVSGDYTAEILNRPDNGVWTGLTGSGSVNNVSPLYATREDTVIPTPVPGATSSQITFAQNQEFSEVNQWYPFLNVAPDGSLFQSGPIPRLHNVTLNGTSGVSVAATPGDQVPASHAQMRTFGNSIMFDEGKLLVTGGSRVRGSGAAKTAMIIDINGAAVAVTPVPDMRFPRTHHNAVVLPTGEVMVVGGNNSGKQFLDEGFRNREDPTNANEKWPTDMFTESVLTPEVYDPGSNTWRDLDEMTVPRNYHSVGILLQDGTVLAAGGGLCGDPNASNSPTGPACNHPNGQVFKPPYLFKANGQEAPRPAIGNLSNVGNDGTGLPRIGYGQEFTVTMTNLGEGSSISRFTMIKLSSVTHSINTDVRFLEVDFSGSDKTYTLTTDDRNTVLTPGYYFLFAINDKGVPSIAQVVQIQ